MLLAFLACLNGGSSLVAQTEDTLQQLQKIDDLLTTFYQKPTQAQMNQLTKSLSEHSDEISLRTSLGLFSAIVMGYASQKNNLQINGQGEVFDAAKAIAADDESARLVQYLKNHGSVDQTRLDIWWYSFFATGDSQYLDRILEQTGDLFADEFRGDARAALIANGSLMTHAAKHKAVAQYCEKALVKKALVKNQDHWRESLLKHCLAFSKTKPIKGKKFDRSTPEGTLRLFTLGVMANDANLVRSTVYPMDEGDLKYLLQPTDGQQPSSSQWQSLVANMKYDRLKAGTSWTTQGGTKMDVPQEMDSDRGVTAYLGPREMSPAPFQIMKFYGQWWVQPEPVILMRKAAERVRNKNANE